MISCFLDRIRKKVNSSPSSNVRTTELAARGAELGCKHRRTCSADDGIKSNKAYKIEDGN